MMSEQPTTTAAAKAWGQIERRLNEYEEGISDHRREAVDLAPQAKLEREEVEALFDDLKAVAKAAAEAKRQAQQAREKPVEGIKRRRLIDAEPAKLDIAKALEAAQKAKQQAEAAQQQPNAEAEPEAVAAPAVVNKKASERDFEIPEAPLPPQGATVFERLLYPRGLLGHVVQYILDTDRRQDRPIALAAALVACHKALDRKVLGPGDISVILFLILIAESGGGKQHAINCLRVLLRAMGLEGTIAGGGIASMQSIEEILEGKKGVDAKPSALIIQDEYGSSFLSRISGQTGNVAEIPSTLQSLWGLSPKMEWQGSIKVGKDVVPVHGPAFSIFGISTEYAFFAAIKKKQVSGGFVNRHLMIKAGNDGRGKLEPVKPKYDLLQCPEWLVKALKEVAGKPAPIDNRPLRSGPWVVTDFRRIDWGPGAEELCVAFEVENRSRVTVEERELWVPAHEIAARMATVQAVFRGATAAEVDDIVWGIEFARYSTAQLGRGMAKHMLEELEQAELIEHIRDLFRHNGMMTHGEIRKLCERKTKDLRQIDQPIYQLETTEEITEVKHEGGPGRPTRRWQWERK
jgi:hypothetical protein